MIESTKHPKPEGLQLDALYDAAWDIIDNRTTTLHPDSDPEWWIYWLRRYYSIDELSIESHTDTALILKRF